MFGTNCGEAAGDVWKFPDNPKHFSVFGIPIQAKDATKGLPEEKPKGDSLSIQVSHFF